MPRSLVETRVTEGHSLAAMVARLLVQKAQRNDKCRPDFRIVVVSGTIRSRVSTAAHTALEGGKRVVCITRIRNS